MAISKEGGWRGIGKDTIHWDGVLKANTIYADTYLNSPSGGYPYTYDPASEAYVWESLAGYASEAYVNDAVSAVEGYPYSYDPASEAYVTNAIADFITEADLAGYASEAYVASQLAGYASEAYVDSAIDGRTVSEAILIVCSDETTALTASTAIVSFRMPYAMTLSEVRASVTTAPTSQALIVDINENGSTIMSASKLKIDDGEKTSTTSSSSAIISDTALADDAEITIDTDQVGSTIAGAGLKVTLLGVRA